MTEPRRKIAARKFRRPGRPSRLTPELGDAIVETIADGNYLETAAALNGVSKQAVYRWVQRADDAEAAALEHYTGDDAPAGDELYDHVPPDDWPFLDFRNALKAAEAHAEVIALRDVRKAEPGWQAHMTFLERRHPDRWRRRDRVELDANVTGGTERTRTVEAGSEERQREIAAVVAEALSRPAGVDSENSPEQEEV